MEEKNNTGKIVAIIIAVCAGIALIAAGILIVPGLIVKSEIDSAKQEATESYEDAKQKAMSDYEDAKDKALSDYEDAKQKAIEDYEKAKQEAQSQLGN